MSFDLIHQVIKASVMFMALTLISTNSELCITGFIRATVVALQVITTFKNVRLAYLYAWPPISYTAQVNQKPKRQAFKANSNIPNSKYF